MLLDTEFIKFIEQYKQLIFKIASLYCRDPEFRKDLLQDITLQLWKSFSRFDPAISGITWVYRIALNVSISYVRKEKSRLSFHEKYARNWDIFNWSDPDIEDRVTLLHTYLEQLKPLDRAIIILYLDGKRHAEIGEIVGITETSVSTRMHRIKEVLKSKISV